MDFLCLWTGAYFVKTNLVFEQKVATRHLVEHELENTSWHIWCLNGMKDDI